jgi:CRP-like cAMP-binding protein
MKQFFNTFGLINEKELDLVDSLSRKRLLKKGEYLTVEGNVSNEIALIKSGILRLFYTNASGEEITGCLAFDNELLSAYSSFITQQPSEENIQAVCDTEIITLTKENLDLLYSRDAGWQMIGRILAEMHYVELTKKIISFQKDTAKERYNKLITQQPQYIQAIPQYQLASFLGITPRHLSRLRKEF